MKCSLCNNKAEKFYVIKIYCRRCLIGEMKKEIKKTKNKMQEYSNQFKRQLKWYESELKMAEANKQ